MTENSTKQREILILDEYGPEATAMMQALYSRDPKSVVVHIEDVKKKGHENFMSKFYVGYGHKSIGDCGSTTICIENVSMLVAKAIQDWPLYSGQEASTRYLDMSKQEVLNPLGREAGRAIQNRWMQFYEKVLAELIATLPERFPIKDGEDEKDYRKAIKAKAFDIARGFLPAGVTTYVSWHTNLRQAHDHLKEMRHHPLEEVREVANATLQQLKEKYPSSFNYEINEKDEEYLKNAMNAVSYYHVEKGENYPFQGRHALLPSMLTHYADTLISRPKRSELPKQLRACGNFYFEFLLDFGSFRDLQRQRSMIQPMPLLTNYYGFEKWYLDQLPDDLRIEAEQVIKEQKIAIESLLCSKEDMQYYIAMGNRVLCVIQSTLPAAVYIAELRSGQLVHPTLRKIAQSMGRVIKEAIPDIALYCDMEPDAFSIKRGKQDIVKKEEV